MARLKGKLQIEGTLDEMSFYKTQDGIIVRQKWGPDKKRMLRDPAFFAVVEHGKDFGRAAKYSSFFRGRLSPSLGEVYDNRVTGRVNKVMLQILKLDEDGVAGKRSINKSLLLPAAAGLLAGFEFNLNSLLKDRLLRMPDLFKRKGKLFLEGKLSSKDFRFPKEASHVGLSVAWLDIDLEERDSQLAVSREFLIARKTAALSVSLNTLENIKPGSNSFFILRLRFYKKTIFGMEAAEKGLNAAAILPREMVKD